MGDKTVIGKEVTHCSREGGACYFVGCTVSDLVLFPFIMVSVQPCLVSVSCEIIYVQNEDSLTWL